MFKCIVLFILFFSSATAYSAGDKKPPVCNNMFINAGLPDPDNKMLKFYEYILQMSDIQSKLRRDIFSDLLQGVFVNGEIAENFRDPNWVADQAVKAVRLYLPSLTDVLAQAIERNEISIPQFYLDLQAANDSSIVVNRSLLLTETEAADLTQEFATLISAISNPDLSMESLAKEFNIKKFELRYDLSDPIHHFKISTVEFLKLIGQEILNKIEDDDE